ncbi:MAG: diphthine--ammonia ligase [Planctomycetota bacterium]
MPDKEKVVFSWSGGKDSALALYELRKDDRYEIVALLSTVAGEYGRVSHHGVREELLRMQAEAIGLPLDVLYLPMGPSGSCGFEDYEELMGRTMARYREAGVLVVVHGDVFLEDLREYREAKLAKVGMEALFPIWGRDTTELVRAFIRLGFKAYLSCVDGEKLPAAFAGRAIDAELLSDLPNAVDPCGENGEFHSFVYDGPIFKRPLEIQVGEVVSRDTRHFADLLPRG